MSRVPQPQASMSACSLEPPRCELAAGRSLKVFAEVTGLVRVDSTRSGSLRLLYFSAVLSAAAGDRPPSPQSADSQMPLLPLTDATADKEDRRLLQFPSMMQDRRELPGRIIFTVGVAMSSTRVALILIRDFPVCRSRPYGCTVLNPCM
jgi:hypothetical protein